MSLLRFNSTKGRCCQKKSILYALLTKPYMTLRSFLGKLEACVSNLKNSYKVSSFFICPLRIDKTDMKSVKRCFPCMVESPPSWDRCFPPSLGFLFWAYLGPVHGLAWKADLTCFKQVQGKQTSSTIQIMHSKNSIFQYIILIFPSMSWMLFIVFQ